MNIYGNVTNNLNGSQNINYNQNFQFDKIFSNRYVLNCTKDNDGIYLKRSVLVDYDQDLTKTLTRVVFENGVCKRYSSLNSVSLEVYKDPIVGEYVYSINDNDINANCPSLASSCIFYQWTKNENESNYSWKSYTIDTQNPIEIITDEDFIKQNTLLFIQVNEHYEIAQERQESTNIYYPGQISNLLLQYKYDFLNNSDQTKNTYNFNSYIDQREYSKMYDSTVWQKYLDNNNSINYITIAKLGGESPVINGRVVPPNQNGLPYIPNLSMEAKNSYMMNMSPIPSVRIDTNCLAVPVRLYEPNYYYQLEKITMEQAQSKENNVYYLLNGSYRPVVEGHSFNIENKYYYKTLASSTDYDSSVIYCFSGNDSQTGNIMTANLLSFQENTYYIQKANRVNDNQYEYKYELLRSKDDVNENNRDSLYYLFSDENGIISTYTENQNIISEEIPVNIYYNKDGFEKLQRSYSEQNNQISLNLNGSSGYKYPSYSEYILVTDLSKIENEILYCLNEDNSGYTEMLPPYDITKTYYRKQEHSQTNSYDINQLSINLPAIGNAICEFWDMMYGQDRNTNVYQYIGSGEYKDPTENNNSASLNNDRNSIAGILNDSVITLGQLKAAASANVIGQILNLADFIGVLKKVVPSENVDSEDSTELWTGLDDSNNLTLLDWVNKTNENIQILSQHLGVENSYTTYSISTASYFSGITRYYTDKECTNPISQENIISRKQFEEAIAALEIPIAYFKINLSHPTITRKDDQDSTFNDRINNNLNDIYNIYENLIGIIDKEHLPQITLISKTDYTNNDVRVLAEAIGVNLTPQNNDEAESTIDFIPDLCDGTIQGQIHRNDKDIQHISDILGINRNPETDQGNGEASIEEPQYIDIKVINQQDLDALNNLFTVYYYDDNNTQYIPAQNYINFLYLERILGDTALKAFNEYKEKYPLYVFEDKKKVYQSNVTLTDNDKMKLYEDPSNYTVVNSYNKYKLLNFEDIKDSSVNNLNKIFESIDRLEATQSNFSYVRVTDERDIVEYIPLEKDIYDNNAEVDVYLYHPNNVFDFQYTLMTDPNITIKTANNIEYVKIEILNSDQWSIASGIYGQLYTEVNSTIVITNYNNATTTYYYPLFTADDKNCYQKLEFYYPLKYYKSIEYFRRSTIVEQIKNNNYDIYNLSKRLQALENFIEEGHFLFTFGRKHKDFIPDKDNYNIENIRLLY